MKKLLLLVLISTLLLTACNAAATSETAGGDSYTSPNLPVNYDGALPVRNQLALGLLMLAGTDLEPTPEQAQELILLWQALLATQNSGSAAAEETAALLNQIEELLTPEQLAEIAAMQLTNSDMQTWASENGITMGAGGGQGAGKNLSPEARATRQAEEGRTSTGTGGSSGSAAIIDALIVSLKGLAP